MKIAIDLYRAQCAYNTNRAIFEATARAVCEVYKALCESGDETRVILCSEPGEACDTMLFALENTVARDSVMTWDDCPGAPVDIRGLLKEWFFEQQGFDAVWEARPLGDGELPKDVSSALHAQNSTRPETVRTLGEVVEQIKQSFGFATKSDRLRLAQAICADEVSTGRKTLYIDMSSLVHVNFVTGIQRVTLAVTETLLNMSRDFDVIPVYTYKNSQLFFTAERIKDRFKISSSDLHKRCVDFKKGDVLLMLDLNVENAHAGIEGIKRLRRSGVRIMFVIYDLIPIDFPDYFPKGQAKGHDRWLRAISCSDGVVAISQAALNRYERWVRDNQVVLPPYFIRDYFTLGADISAAIPSKGLPVSAKDNLRKIGERTSLLMVSTIEPRKRHQQALAAMELLWKKGRDVSLVIVGGMGWKIPEFKDVLTKHPEFGKRLFWLGRVSDEYLDLVYKASSAVLMASEEEGFGLSIVEGSKYMKPLILRDIPVFREVAGDHAFYFTGFEAKDLADALDAWLLLYGRGEAPSSLAIHPMTWQESAQMLLKTLPL